MSAAAATDRRPRHALPIGVLVAVVVAGIGTTIVAYVTRALGAEPSFRALQPPIYLSFTVIGILAGSLAWWLVSRTAWARTTMSRLAPAVVLLSFVPDVAVGVTEALPGTTWTGVIGLMVMHVVVAASALISLSRAWPLRDRPAATPARGA